MTSRKRPPVPVSAPGNGATPLGKLCVSAVRIGCNVCFWTLMELAVPTELGLSAKQSYPRIEDELS